MSIVVAQFCHTYPGEYRNGDISFNLFWLLWSQRHRVWSLNKAILAQSNIIGRNCSYDKTGTSKQELRNLSDFAEGLRDKT